jgi:two-component system response regulator HydG
MADHGTLFLDEIGDVSPSVQAKLLRVLQEHAFERVGGTRTIEVDIRVVAATNQDLRRRVAEKQFREDLFFRLSVVPITVPPLRERREDIPLLVESFLERFRRELARPGLSIDPEALAAIVEHDWPGNVRELENCIERASIVTDDGTIRVKDLTLSRRTSPARSMDDLRSALSSGTLAESLERMAPLAERARIDAAVQRHGDDLAAAAAELGLSVEDLRARLKTTSPR